MYTLPFELMSRFLGLRKEKTSEKNDIRHVQYKEKYNKKIKINAKYRAWLKRHNIPYKNNYNIYYNKRQKKWVKNS